MKHKLILWFLTCAWAGLTWHLTTTPNLVIAPENLLNTLIMLSAHFIFFGIQAFLLALALPAQTRSLTPSFLALSLASLYGLAIELVQRDIPGRSADPLDWFLDTLGAVTFLLLLKKLQSKL